MVLQIKTQKGFEVRYVIHILNLQTPSRIPKTNFWLHTYKHNTNFQMFLTLKSLQTCTTNHGLRKVENLGKVCDASEQNAKRTSLLY